MEQENWGEGKERKLEKRAKKKKKRRKMEIRGERKTKECEQNEL